MLKYRFPSLVSFFPLYFLPHIHSPLCFLFKCVFPVFEATPKFCPPKITVNARENAFSFFGAITFSGLTKIKYSMFRTYWEDASFWSPLLTHLLSDLYILLFYLKYITNHHKTLEFYNCIKSYDCCYFYYC